MRLIGDMLGQLYQDRCLYQCLCEALNIRPERLKQLHYIVMNYDRMSPHEIREKAYKYGTMIEDEDLIARQMFLCLLRLADKVEKQSKA